MDISLRPARPADADEMATWFVNLMDLAIWGGPGVSFPLTREQLAAWIAEGANPAPRTCFTAVEADDRPWGHVQFLHDPVQRWARLGRFGIAPGRRGKGQGRALLEHAIGHAFTELAVDHLALAVVVGNERAHRLYLSAGFREEGRGPGEWTVAGKPYVMNLMGLIRGDWEKRATRPADAMKVA